MATTSSPAKCAEGTERGKVKRFPALIQLIVIILIVGFGTWQLFLGNFEPAFSTLPLLLIYYVFVISRQRRP